MTGQGSNENSYDRHRRELENILSDAECSDDLKKMIEEALQVPTPTIEEEMFIYDLLKQNPSPEARERLFKMFSSLALLCAWSYRHLGVPIEQLIDAAQARLLDSAYLFQKSDKPGFYQVALCAVEEGVFDELDRHGVEQVSPDEVHELLRNGDIDSAYKILASLTALERWILECRFGKFSDDPQIAGTGKTGTTSDISNKKLAIVLRKLRRRK